MGAAAPAVALQEIGGSPHLLPEDGATSLLPGLDLLKNQESVLLLCLLPWMPELRGPQCLCSTVRAAAFLKISLNKSSPGHRRPF